MFSFTALFLVGVLSLYSVLHSGPGGLCLQTIYMLIIPTSCSQNSHLSFLSVYSVTCSTYLLFMYFHPVHPKLNSPYSFPELLLLLCFLMQEVETPTMHFPLGCQKQGVLLTISFSLISHPISCQVLSFPSPTYL